MLDSIWSLCLSKVIQEASACLGTLERLQASEVDGVMLAMG